jgi:hypothetical protein
MRSGDPSAIANKVDHPGLAYAGGNEDEKKRLKEENKKPP